MTAFVILCAVLYVGLLAVIYADVAMDEADAQAAATKGGDVA